MKIKTHNMVRLSLVLMTLLVSTDSLFAGGAVWNLGGNTDNTPPNNGLLSQSNFLGATETSSIQIGTLGNAPTTFLTNGTQRMRILQGTGNVGIGTPTPIPLANEKVHVRFAGNEITGSNSMQSEIFFKGTIGGLPNSYLTLQNGNTTPGRFNPAIFGRNETDNLQVLHFVATTANDGAGISPNPDIPLMSMSVCYNNSEVI